LWDRSGEVARILVLDTVTHLAYSAMFLLVMEGVLAVKVTVKDGLGVEGMGEVLNLAREVFALEETEIDVEIEETT
jgi:hypothetical protein